MQKLLACVLAPPTPVPAMERRTRVRLLALLALGFPGPRRRLIAPISRPQAEPPHKLSPSVSLRENKEWLNAWAGYEELLQLRAQPAKIQLA